jgi:hypothetical protein
MARAKKPTVEPEQVRGLKHLRRINKLLHRLHDDATARDRAGNRTLFYDQYAALVLIAMFSPAIDSLRAIQQASEMVFLRGNLHAIPTPVCIMRPPTRRRAPSGFSSQHVSQTGLRECIQWGGRRCRSGGTVPSRAVPSLSTVS